MDFQIEKALITQSVLPHSITYHYFSSIASHSLYLLVKILVFNDRATVDLVNALPPVAGNETLTSVSPGLERRDALYVGVLM